jgi:hypothetical protein
MYYWVNGNSPDAAVAAGDEYSGLKRVKFGAGIFSTAGVGGLVGYDTSFTRRKPAVRIRPDPSVYFRFLKE